MKITNKTITEIVDTDLLDYSMYVLQNRAIPSAIDGLKNSARKLVYSMLTEYPTKRVKCAELAASIAKYGFHHGEASAEGAIVTLTADWNNNCPVFEGYGNFGSRLIPESAAARYIFCSLSPEFKKIFIDNEVTQSSNDEESPEPIHYLPIIPWVICNGVSGLAVGFACNILPHSIKDITKATKDYLKNPKKFLDANEPIPPTFPHFNGIIQKESETSWSTLGIVEYVGKYTYKISELPVGYSRESYITALNTMVDKDLIKDYEDSCSDQGFSFSIKTTGAQKESIDKDPIKYFKLQKFHTENLTTLGIDGKLKIFKSVAELIAYFCDYRLTKFQDKINYDVKKIETELQYLIDKKKFISEVIKETFNFKKMTKCDLLDFVFEHVTGLDHGKTFIRIPLYECTIDEISKLDSLINENTVKLVDLNLTTPKQNFEKALATLK